MTLDTRVRGRWDETVEPAAVHEKVFRTALEALLRAAGRQGEASTAMVECVRKGDLPKWVRRQYPALGESYFRLFRADRDRWQTTIGQGLPGIVTVYREKSFFEVSWDTGYGYNENGINCTSLHVSAMLHLRDLLAEIDGLRFSTWNNEYAGTWHRGIRPKDLQEFLGGGDNAMEWFKGILVPMLEKNGVKFF